MSVGPIGPVFLDRWEDAVDQDMKNYEPAEDIVGDSIRSGDTHVEATPESEVERTKNERGAIYGDPLVNHKGIGAMWTCLLEPHVDKIRKCEPIPAYTVALMMAALKINRMRNVYHRDNYLDAGIYLEFAEKFQRYEEDRNHG